MNFLHVILVPFFVIFAGASSVRAAEDLKVIHLQAEVIGMARDAANSLIDSSATSADHTQALLSARKLAVTGEAKVLSAVTLITRSGQRGRVESVGEVSWIAGYRKVEGGDEYEPELEERSVGTIFEVDPLIGADGVTLEISFSVEHHYTAPEFRSSEIVHPGTGEKAKIDLATFFFNKITSAVTVTSGQPKIVGVWPQVAGDDAANELIVVFLKAVVQPAASPAAGE